MSDGLSDKTPWNVFERPQFEVGSWLDSDVIFPPFI